jgi:misacylated tRNA(Ala) deacylase
MLLARDINMNTKLLYQTDSYLKQFTAKALAIQDGALIFEQTAFYPGGGGQPADAGVIRWQNQNLALRKVEKKGDAVLHHLDGYGPQPGDDIEGVLDWERRYALMRTHTALHILCGVIWRDFGAPVTGGNMEPLKARMDFELESMSADFAERVEAAVNCEIMAAREIRVRILPREEAFQIPDLIRTKINLLPEGIQQVRTVEIVGLDLQADGGTHVANTREVGRIKIAGHESKGKINKRLRIVITN